MPSNVQHIVCFLLILAIYILSLIDFIQGYKKAKVNFKGKGKFTLDYFTAESEEYTGFNFFELVLFCVTLFMSVLMLLSKIYEG